MKIVTRVNYSANAITSDSVTRVSDSTGVTILVTRITFLTE